MELEAFFIGEANIKRVYSGLEAMMKKKNVFAYENDANKLQKGKERKSFRNKIFDRASFITGTSISISSYGTLLN